MHDKMEVRKKHERRKKRKRKSTYRRTLKIVLVFLIFVVILLISALLFWKFGSQNLKNDLLKVLLRQQVVRNIVAEEVKDEFEKVQDKDFNEDDIIVNEEVGKKLTGYQNIVLFGIDARDDTFNSYTRSDAIMIISINNDTGAVRIVSLYRDTYLNIIQNDEDKTFMKTSLEYDEIMDLVPVIIDYNIEASSGFPFTLQTVNLDGADLVVAEGMACNVSALHSFLFNDKDYQPSKTVDEIDSYITNCTGVQPCIPVLEEIEYNGLIN